MNEKETTTQRTERLAKLLDNLISRVQAGAAPRPLREHLEVAIMMSPLSRAQQAAAFARFDGVVAATPDNGSASI